MNKCPICKRNYEAGTHAISRVDNETEICSACGTNEAFDISKSIAMIIIKAINDKDRKAFDKIIEKFPRLPRKTMELVNLLTGQILFEYEE